MTLIKYQVDILTIYLKINVFDKSSKHISFDAICRHIKWYPTNVKFYRHYQCDKNYQSNVEYEKIE